MDQYTPNQQEDIKKRVASAEQYLKGMNLYPSAVVQKVNLGKDIFADQVICFLADSKYTPQTSPLQKNDIKKTP